MFAAHSSPAASYRQMAVETSLTDADPHRLIAMLYDGAIESIGNARRALDKRDIAARGAAITKAIRIIDEGLKASLDMRAGEIATNLDALYGYMTRRLLRANMDADDTALLEVAGLIDQLRSAWTQIAPARADASR